MPSSKFNRHPTPRLRPAICYPPPGSCWPLFTNEDPAYFRAWVHWKDLAHAVPIDWKGTVYCDPTIQVGIWDGRRRADLGWIGMRVTRMFPPIVWMLTIYVIRWFGPDEAHYFYHFYEDWSKPFDSRIMSHVHEVGVSYRQIHVRG